MEKFLHKVARELIKSGEYYRKIVVLPNKRSGIFLKKALIDIEQKPVLAPQIVSIQDFIDSLSDLRQTDQLHLLFHFFQAYKAIFKDKSQSFDEFINWALPILSDFNELDAFDVNAKEVFTYINEVKKIEDWQLKPEQPKLISDYLKFYESLYDLYVKFKERLIEQNLAYTGMISRNVAQQIEQIARKFQDKQIIFAGFNALTATQEKIIKYLVDNNKATIYWDADEYYMKQGFEAGKFLMNHYGNFKNFKWIDKHFDQSKKIEMIAVPGKVTQVQAIAKILSENTSSDLETAIVLNEEDLLLPLINSLPRNIDTVNVTLGLSLYQLPVVQVFLQLVKLYFEKEKYGRFHIDTIINFIHLPYFENILKENEHLANQQLLENLTRFKTNLISGDLIFQILENSGSFFKKIIVKNIDVIKLLNIFSELLLFISEKDLPDLDKPAVVKLEKTFEYLRNFIIETGEINDMKTFQVLLNRLLHQERLNFEGEPLQGLQIMGILETRLLDFKHVILTSMNEGVIPNGKTLRSIIPFELKKHFGLPLHYDQNAIIAYHFYRLIQRAEKVTLIYVDDNSGFGSGEVSRFLIQLKNELKPMHQITERNLEFSSSLLPAPLLEVNKDQRIMNKIKEIAKNGFSPSALTTYIRNPLLFYKSKILELEPAEPVGESIPANIMGNIIHQVLEKLYEPVINKVLTLTDFDLMLERYEKISLQQFIAHSFGENVPVNIDLISGKNLIVFEIIKKNVKDIILRDKRVVATGNNLEIIRLEQYYKLKLPVNNQEVYIKGFVDRIDRLNGKIRIIDYKTGKVDNKEISLYGKDKDLSALLQPENSGKLFQLLTYAWLYFHSGQISTSDLPFTAGIISTRHQKSGLLQANIFGQTDIDTGIINEFEKVLINLTTEILNPAIPFVETDAEY